MINTLLALAALSPISGDPQVAFVARYYYPYPDKRISAHQVYVTDIDGNNRKQLTTGKPSPEQLSWVGANVVCWIERFGRDKDELVHYNLQTKTKKVLLRRNGTLTLIGRYDLFKNGGFPEYDDGVTRYQVTESGAKPVGKSVEIEWTRGREKASWNLPGEPAIRFIGYEEDEVAESAEFPYNDYLYAFERDGRQYKWRLEGAANDFYPGAKPGTAYLHSIEGGASAGTWECFYLVNWGSGEIRTLISDACYIAIRKGTRYWSGLEAGRTLSPYGPKKNVWTCEAYVGDIESGKQWAIVSGLAECYEIALR
jgi:hypothetical protein